MGTKEGFRYRRSAEVDYASLELLQTQKFCLNQKICAVLTKTDTGEYYCTLFLTFLFSSKTINLLVVFLMMAFFYKFQPDINRIKDKVIK